MKPMIWRPEEKDKQVNEYLDQVNHAPYLPILAGMFGLFCLFTLSVMLGVF